MPDSYTFNSSHSSGGSHQPTNSGQQAVGTGHKSIHLVGSARLEINDILENAGLSPRSDAEHLGIASELREIAQTYQQTTHRNILDHSGLSPESITGKDMLTAVAEQIEDPNIRRNPIINLAPLTVQILHGATHIQKQLIEIYSDGSIVEWEAPQTTPHIHRAVFHGLADSVNESRAGFIGDEQRGYLNQQFKQDIAELTEKGYRTVLILDDRCSGQSETLRHVRARMGREHISTLAFVVGHAAVPRVDDNNQLFRDRATGVRIYAPVFRYQKAGDERLPVAGAAEELKDLGYCSAAGHCHMIGYNGFVANALKNTQYSISQWLSTHNAVTAHALEELHVQLSLKGVTVVNQELLHQFLHRKQFSATSCVENRDLRDLFSHDPRILEIGGHSTFDPNLASRARLPMLWPGKPTPNSFHNALKAFNHTNPEQGWLRLSYHQLAATIEVVEGLTTLTGSTIPITAFPFLSLDSVRACLPESAWNAQQGALDVLHLLLKQLKNECGIPTVFYPS